MFNFFKRKHTGPSAKTATVDNAAMAPGTQICFDEQLIPNLLADHQEFLRLFGEISKAYERGNFSALSKNLDAFSSGLRSHLLLENIKLYVYLQHVLENDEESTAIMDGFRREMKEIGKAVNEFLIKYNKEEWDEDMKTCFHNDLTKIGVVLTKRIQTEEASLYPLYMHPSAYK